MLSLANANASSFWHVLWARRGKNEGSLNTWIICSHGEAQLNFNIGNLNVLRMFIKRSVLHSIWTPSIFTVNKKNIIFCHFNSTEPLAIAMVPTHRCSLPCLLISIFFFFLSASVLTYPCIAWLCHNLSGVQCLSLGLLSPLHNCVRAASSKMQHLTRMSSST